MSNTVAISLGSSNTGIYQTGQNVVLFEPSLIAISKNDNSIKEVGFAAKRLVGRTTDNTVVVAPVFESFISDERSCTAMFSRFLNMITVKKFSSVPSVILSVPCGANAAQIKTFESVLRRCDVSDYSLIESPMMTALGLNRSLSTSSPMLIVDIGGGSTQIAVVSLDGIIGGITVNMGGLSIDQMIRRYLDEKFNIRIGSITAEALRERICSLSVNDMTSTVVSGQESGSGIPFSLQLTSEDLREPLTIFFNKIFQIMGMFLSKLPVEVSADIRKSGVYFSGGVSKTVGLEEYFRQNMNMRANISENAQIASILGGGYIAEDKALLKKLRINKR